MAEITQNKTTIIIDNQYFACINYIKNLFKVSHIVIFSSEPYQKMSFRNRCIVAGSNGLVNLSVPLENGRDQKGSFKDVRISYRDAWQRHQWNTLLSCYNKSAFFEFYRDALEKLFLKKEPFLFDLDISILTWLKEVLHFPAEIEVIEDVAYLEKEMCAVDLRDRWRPKNFQDISSNSEFSVPPYFQVFENRIGFQPNLSILDLLFNEGPNASSLLKNSSPG